MNIYLHTNKNAYDHSYELIYMNIHIHIHMIIWTFIWTFGLTMWVFIWIFIRMSMVVTVVYNHPPNHQRSWTPTLITFSTLTTTSTITSSLTWAWKGSAPACFLSQQSYYHIHPICDQICSIYPKLCHQVLQRNDQVMAIYGRVIKYHAKFWLEMAKFSRLFIGTHQDLKNVLEELKCTFYKTVSNPVQLSLW